MLQAFSYCELSMKLAIAPNPIAVAPLGANRIMSQPHHLPFMLINIAHTQCFSSHIKLALSFLIVAGEARPYSSAAATATPNTDGDEQMRHEWPNTSQNAYQTRTVDRQKVLDHGKIFFSV